MLSTVLPSSTGDCWFDSVLCQGRRHNFGYDPTPELPHWMLAELGCRDSRILCRDVPSHRIHWSPRGVERVSVGARRTACWQQWDLGLAPEPGDVLHLGAESRGERPHICVFVSADGPLWTTADVVPCDRTGAWRAQLVVRSVAGDSLFGRRGPSVRINGWMDLERVPYDVPPA